MKELEQELSLYKKMYAELAHENYTFKMPSWRGSLQGSHNNIKLLIKNLKKEYEYLSGK